MNELQISKRLSYLLRHAPHEAGLVLEPGGWVPLDAVLAHLKLTRKQMEQIVAGSDKGRFSLKGNRIRANQGHSVPVDLELEPTVPPEFLYHGTVPDALDAIGREGLRPMERHHVHLSPDVETARIVGARRGSPVILRVQAGAMQRAGHTFFRSENGVWLTGGVPVAFLVIPPR